MFAETKVENLLKITGKSFKASNVKDCICAYIYLISKLFLRCYHLQILKIYNSIQTWGITCLEAQLSFNVTSRGDLDDAFRDDDDWLQLRYS
jgi:hypothetical protein